MSGPRDETPVWVGGLTPASLAAALFCLLLTGVLTQYSEIILGLSFPAEHTLAVPAILSFMTLLLVCRLGAMALRAPLLNRQEMLCVLFIQLIAVPLMTQGFWHRMVAITSTPARTSDFAKLEVMGDSFWPRGRNLLQGAFAEAPPLPRETVGGVEWTEVDLTEGGRARAPTLVNTAKDERSVVRLRLPVEWNLLPGDPYVLHLLVRARDLGPNSQYDARAYAEGETAYTELFRSSSEPRPTFQHRTGFGRAGAYGVKLPVLEGRPLVVEFGLQGPGRLELWDPQLVSVAALESVYKGRRIVTQEAFDALPLDLRAGLVVRPNSLWSLAGVRFLLAGYIPVREWATPMLTWTSFVLLVLLGGFAINILVRKQWMEGERFQLPMAQIPAALADAPDDQTTLPPIWTNRLMWMGLALALGWELMKAWNGYNPKVPDLRINVPLEPYFSGPNWGKTWSHMRFEVVAIFLALGIFMELNVLLSMVAGVFLFQSQFWVGRMFELDTQPDYPWPFHQGLGAFIGYALVILFFTRKPLGRVLAAALRGDRKASAGEALSYRAALLLLFACVAGTAIWARMVGAGLHGIMVFYVLLLLIGFVSCRLRTECGLPWGYFVPGNLAAFMLVLGGVQAFGAESILFCYTASFMLAPTVFFLIPGAHMELLEWGRRWQVRPRHLLWAGILGVLGGMLVGGWVFLSNAYALGGETSPYAWAFDSKPWYYFSYNQEMGRATTAVLSPDADGGAPGDPGWWAFGISAIVTMILSALRQVFAGFWFHPAGFLLGSTMQGFIHYVWGSLLTAYVIRSVVLRLGGAATVRNKLQPFFVGVFLGAVLAYAVLGTQTAFVKKATGVHRVHGFLSPP